jgi:surface antigen
LIVNKITHMRTVQRLAAPLALAVLALAVYGCAELPAEEEAPPPPPVVPAEPAPQPVPIPVQVAEPAPAPAVAETAPVAEPLKPEPTVSTGQKANYVGYTGIPWSKDYGVVSGRCDPAAAAKALGMQDDPRSVALLVAGSGEAKLIDSMEDRDRACMGHSLELVRKGSSAAWSNKETGRAYRLTMGQDYVHDALPCREFSAVVTVSGAQETVKGGACRHPEAKWELHLKK